ncbi:hypothetical protein K7I13_10565 [Brucepastera parasyntrophica]|uniref:hypothetical protein n=1 Tax=Brucepastera parasyntrophica TaxID=2880008 RepID=UPI002109389C|nr:hypothetical protein [Brucepastera parasyntrophica]ULQ58958.1 hypothetical protein K7I13_10565 [Brucepastera parasyntrophica]
MHHAIRNNNRDVLSVLFYGQDITPEERQTAEQIVKANALNRNALSYSVQFYSDSGKIREDGL